MTKYDLIQDKNSFHDDFWTIKIMEGKFEGHTYQYDVLQMKEDGTLNFNVIVLQKPCKPKDQDQLTEVYREILVDLITAQITLLDAKYSDE